MGNWRKLPSFPPFGGFNRIIPYAKISKRSALVTRLTTNVMFFERLAKRLTCKNYSLVDYINYYVSTSEYSNTCCEYFLRRYLSASIEVRIIAVQWVNRELSDVNRLWTCSNQSSNTLRLSLLDYERWKWRGERSPVELVARQVKTKV